MLALASNWYAQVWISCSHWGMFALLPHDETHPGPIAYVIAGRRSNDYELR